ncbi:21373_t:CDS:2, partial [Dentiscutata erythropus]
KMFKAIYEDPNNHLTWPKVLIVDKGTEYLGECRDLLLSHGVKIIQAKSKRSTSIAEQWILKTQTIQESNMVTRCFTLLCILGALHPHTVSNNGFRRLTRQES